MGFVIARFLYLRRVQEDSNKGMVVEDIEMDKDNRSGNNEPESKLLSEAVSKIGKIEEEF